MHLSYCFPKQVKLNATLFAEWPTKSPNCDEKIIKALQQRKLFCVPETSFTDIDRQKSVFWCLNRLVNAGRGSVTDTWPVKEESLILTDRSLNLRFVVNALFNNNYFRYQIRIRSFLDADRDVKYEEAFFIVIDFWGKDFIYEFLGMILRNEIYILMELIY